MRKLSICITTRNRARLLEETLATIVPQLSSDVELVIVDGASSDNTEEVVSRAAASGAPINFHRAVENRGLDHDYDLAVRQACGRWCWFLSDDDLIEADAVALILQQLVLEPTVIVVNASVYDANMQRCLVPSRLGPATPLRFGRGQWRDVFAAYIDHLTFIGALVVERAFWMSRERAKFFGSEFVHVGALFAADAPEATAAAILRPLIRIRYGLGNWRRRGFEVWMVKWPRLIASFDWLDAEAREAAARPRQWRYWKKLVMFRGQGWYTPADFRRHVILRERHPAYLAAAAIVSALPKRATASALLAYHRWRGNPAIVTYDLERTLEEA